MHLGTQSAGSLFCGNSLGLPEIRLGRLLATLFFVPVSLLAQLTTGSIEGTLRDIDGHPLAGSAIVVNGATGFRAVIRTDWKGEFAITLPTGDIVCPERPNAGPDPQPWSSSLPCRMYVSIS